MLESSSITATVSGETSEVFTTMGCLQGRCFFPPFKNLVVEGFFSKPNVEGHYTTAYADDSAFPTNGKFSQTV
jgi:hypothetical protein